MNPSKAMAKSVTLCAVLATLALAACQDTPAPTAPDQESSFDHRASGPSGAVYVQTNDASRNEIVAYRRAPNGPLDLIGTFATGGKGTGMPRLGSQGSVILSDDNRWLLVTNVGSDEISVFSVSDGRLRLTDKVRSHGDMPFSLALRGNLLYVLNAGGAGNITAFTLNNSGRLSHLSHSTRPLSGSVSGSSTAPAPAQVSFSPDGGTLVVTEKATSIIDTYTVGSDGLASGPTVHNSNGETPFGFAFRSDGIFVVTEAHNAAPGRPRRPPTALRAAFGASAPACPIPRPMSAGP